ncbi:MAG TPA: hypothetical protein PKB10_02970 [Tepidisphaeraceae bacterium]|nr:hypothetical protein [Tepidisphaeraceae bacterium]
MDLLLQMEPAARDLSSLGAAGLMGVMWLWERRNSQKREQQLDEAHARIVADRLQLDLLADLVRQTTAAITHLSNRIDHVLGERDSHERA